MSDGDRHAWERPGVERVADGVHRIPLPLPNDGLKAVNVYAIEQDDGLVLIDSGWAMAEAQDLLETCLGELDHDLGSIRRVLVTHVHRDHYELSITLRRLFGTKVALGLGEQPALHAAIERNPDLDPKGPMHDRMQRAGAAELLQTLGVLRARAMEKGLAPVIDWQLPDEWLLAGQVLELDGRHLDVIHTPGHTQGHVVFADLDAGVLFSGDHVLPHITPSIGFENVPAASPLGDYLASLALVRAMPDLAMLPAHGPVRPTTHDRIDELIAHHDHRLDASLQAVVAGNSTAYEVARALGWTRRERPFDDLDPFNQMLAVNETAAHLDVLVRQGRLTTRDEPGEHGPVCIYLA